jgi:hypothetical protein
MRPGRPTPPVVLTVEERETLEQWARRPKTAQALAQRARIVLACTTDKTNGNIALSAGVTRQTVGRWRTRFARKRLNGLLDEPRPGAPRKIMDAAVERVVRLTLESTPRDATQLEHPDDGPALWFEPDGREPYWARVRVAAAPGEDLQALEGSAVH